MALLGTGAIVSQRLESDALRTFDVLVCISSGEKGAALLRDKSKRNPAGRFRLVQAEACWPTLEALAGP
jgi:hypothetical protein